MGGSTTLPTTEATTDVSTKPRQRRRGDFYFWQFLILRVPMAVYAIVLFVYLGRYIHKWQGALRQPEDAEYSNPTRKDALEQSGLALSMASVSLGVALWETAARVTPRRYKYGPRSMQGFTIFFDLLVIGLGIPGWMLNFAMAEYYTSPGYPIPWRDDQNLLDSMIMAFWIIHCAISVWGCSACCNCCGCGPKKPSKSKKTAVTPAPVHPAQRQDLEQAGGPEPLPNYKQSTGLEEVEPTTIPEDPPSYPEAVRLPPHAST